MHFFRDLYAELRALFFWRQNDAREKSAQRGNELVKQVLVMVSRKVT